MTPDPHTDWGVTAEGVELLTVEIIDGTNSARLTQPVDGEVWFLS